MAEIPAWLAARRAQSSDLNSMEWDALRTAQELFDRNQEGLVSGEAFNADVTPAIELVRLVRDRVIDECAKAVKDCMPFMIENDATGDGYRAALAAAEQAILALKGNPDAEK
jgi:hypothetical protein